MKVVYSAPNLVMVAHYRTLLESLGIASRIRNEYLAGAAGELPPVECWPQLCVEDAFEQRAQTALREVLQGNPHGHKAWTCAGCGEVIEGQFTECWNCGRSAG
jgi:hypothetical protein